MAEELNRVATMGDMENKQDKLVAGNNITIEGNVINAYSSGRRVQSNWNETDTTADSYIQNKPNLPSAISGITGYDATKRQTVINNNGTLQWTEFNSLLSGSTAPVASQGNNGDLYVES